MNWHLKEGQTCGLKIDKPCNWTFVNQTSAAASRSALSFEKRSCNGNLIGATSIGEMRRRLRQHMLRSTGGAEGFAPSYEIQSWLEAASAQRPRQICEIGFNTGSSALAWLCTFPGAAYTAFDLMRYNQSREAKEFLLHAFGRDRMKVVAGDTLETLPSYARSHPRSCDVMSVDGGHSLRIAYSDLSNMRLLARSASNLVVMDDLRCGWGWCVEPTAAWQYLRQAGVLRESGCSVMGCCSGWCFGEYDLNASQPDASGLCDATSSSISASRCRKSTAPAAERFPSREGYEELRRAGGA
jgi:hypothetical protein